MGADIKLKKREVEAELRLRSYTYYGRVHALLLRETIASVTLSKRKLAKEIIEHKQAEIEIKRERNRAEEATLLKDKFVSMVAHDLKSPFSSILGTLNLILNDKENLLPDRTLKLINRCISNGNNLVELIDKLLDTQRLQSGKIEPIKSFIDLNQLAETVISKLKLLAENKEITLVNEIPEGIRLYADGDLYKEVVLNLISNAVKFTQSGGEITVGVESGEELSLFVLDNGVGIEEKMIPEILNSNSKVSLIGTDGERGTGLGLIFCTEIIKAHGGEIKLESKFGEGSKFTISLPIVVPRVLLVDDEPSVRHACRKMMQKIGAEVIEAGTGKEALEAVKNRPLPHLILTDIRLPGEINGLDLFVMLREKKGLEECPVIVMTGELVSKSHEKAMRLGADDFMNKPIFENELVSRVRRFIA